MRFTETNGVRVVAPANAVVQSWCELKGDTGIGLILDAIRKELTSPGLVRAAAAQTPRVRARGSLNDLLDHVDHGVTSFLEHRARTVVFPPKLFPELLWQHEVRASGRTRLLDAFAADAKLALEFDSVAHHSGDKARLADIQRDAELATIGIQVLRLSYDSVMNQPQWCRETYRAARAARLGANLPGIG
jgi:hypothetical protein